MATRGSSHSSGLSDDPIENVTSWMQLNQKAILAGIGAISVVTLAIVGYRYMDASKRTEASNELYKATAPMAQGKLPEAQAALEKVVKRYDGTSSGSQAALLLAQVLFDQKKYQDGITLLEKARGSAGSDFSASTEALIATGYESLGKHEQAAEHYGLAASAAKFPLDKGSNQASQARSLTTAGKFADARRIWEALSKQEDMPYAQEAQVRLGELAAQGK